MPVPYKGSKRKLAKQIYNLISRENPGANTIVDLFCGGFAVGEEFMLNGWTVYGNDINQYVIALINEVVNNTLPPSTISTFVTRERFFEVKDNPDNFNQWYVGFVLSIYSFGNNFNCYIYGKYIEEYKQKYHEMVQENIDHCRYLSKYCTDYVKSKNQISVECQISRPLSLGSKNRRLDIRRQINVFEKTCQQELVDMQGLQSLKGLENLEWLESFGNLKNLQNLESLENILSLAKLNSLEGLQSIQSLERLDSLQGLEKLQGRLILSSLDYRGFEIPDQAIIYCDIPYIGTSKYGKQDFDHIKFWNWAREQSKTHKVYISEYQAPNDFEVIASFAKVSSYSSRSNKTQTVEKIFRLIAPIDNLTSISNITYI